MNLTLYQLTNEYRAALSELPEDASDLDIDNAIAHLEGAIALKGQNVAAFCLNMEAEADAIAGAAKKLKARADAAQKKADNLRRYLYENMRALGISEIKANDGTFKAKIVKNPPAVEISGPVPAEYERVIPEQREPDKALIKADLKAGVIIEGAKLVQGERLDIK